MKKHLPTILILTLVLGLSALVGWLAWRGVRDGPGIQGDREPAPVAVEVAAVTSGTVRDVRVLTGTLEASSRFLVASKVGGLVQRMLVDLGDPVEPDQVVAWIDDAELRQAVMQAEADLGVREAELARARSDLALAEREFERGEQLRERGIAGVAQLDEIDARLRAAQSTVRLAEAQIASAQSALQLREIELSRARVRATWSDNGASGVVAERHQDPGNTVQANDPIISVVALDPIRAVVFVTERDYTRLRIGQQAAITTDATGATAFEGTIERIAPVFREASRQARIELRVPNPDGLMRPGLFARVRVVLAEEEAGTIVPIETLARRDGRDVVFMIDEDAETPTVRMVEVRPGVIEGGRVALAEPALSGRVVTLGQQLLGDGSRVRVVERRAAGRNGPGPGEGGTGP